MQYNITQIILTIVLLFIIYAIIVYTVASLGNISIKESKAYLREIFFEIISCPSGNVQPSQGDIADILSVIAKFSSINIENTKRTANGFATIPNFRVEILDSDFLYHWEAIQQNVTNIYERMFAYNRVEGLVYVTYERTSKDNLYSVVAYWATTRKSKKALLEMCQNIAEYNRRMDLEKNEPFIDRELEKEMDAMDSHEEV